VIGTVDLLREVPLVPKLLEQMHLGFQEIDVGFFVLEQPLEQFP
jgi:hypothetical protein